MLEEAGYGFTVRPAPYDDADLHHDRLHPAALAMALAYYKAAAVAIDAHPETDVVLGADTLCISPDGSRGIGKPRSHDEARDILRSHMNAEHPVVSAVAIIVGGHRRIFADTAAVTWGNISEPELETYIASEQWRGKAGGYNLTERVNAGWPITCQGDEGTVVGLPMHLLVPVLEELGVRRGAHA